MTWITEIGYLASLLVFATFCMRTMMPLRTVAIGSNICFMVYGFLGHIYPVFFLHLLLLPMNGWRTFELVRLRRRIETDAKTGLPIERFRPFMSRARFDAGHIVFRRGDQADRLYFIVQGELIVEEIEHVLRPGELFGEIALFSADRQRTQTIRCRTDVELLWLTEQHITHLCYDNPEVSLHFLRLITNRLVSNQKRLESLAQPECVAA